MSSARPKLLLLVLSMLFLIGCQPVTLLQDTRTGQEAYNGSEISTLLAEENSATEPPAPCAEPPLSMLERGLSLWQEAETFHVDMELNLDTANEATITGALDLHRSDYMLGTIRLDKNQPGLEHQETAYEEYEILKGEEGTFTRPPGATEWEPWMPVILPPHVMLLRSIEEASTILDAFPELEVRSAETDRFASNTAVCHVVGRATLEPYVDDEFAGSIQVEYWISADSGHILQGLILLSVNQTEAPEAHTGDSGAMITFTLSDYDEPIDFETP